jgi:hypothetical protein
LSATTRPLRPFGGEMGLSGIDQAGERTSVELAAKTKGLAAGRS